MLITFVQYNQLNKFCTLQTCVQSRGIAGYEYKSKFHTTIHSIQLAMVLLCGHLVTNYTGHITAN